MTEFDEIYAAYFHDVFLYVRRLSGNEQIAEDITSETFFKALRTINTFRGECEMRVWLCQIAKNCYFSYLKESRKIEIADPAELLEQPSTESLEDIFLRHEDATSIRSLVHRLKGPYKEVFMLRVIGELSFKQIGSIFQKNENWACVTYHRARKMIQEQMEANQNEE